MVRGAVATYNFLNGGRLHLRAVRLHESSGRVSISVAVTGLNL